MADARVNRPSEIRDALAGWLHEEATHAERDIDRLVGVLASARAARENAIYKSGYDTGHGHGVNRGRLQVAGSRP